MRQALAGLQYQLTPVKPWQVTLNSGGPGGHTVLCGPSRRDDYGVMHLHFLDTAGVFKMFEGASMQLPTCTFIGTAQVKVQVVAIFSIHT